MKRLGQVLIWLGAAVGAAVGAMVLLRIGVPGVSWFVNVALAKLALGAAAGLLGGGAVVQRLANRQDTRRLKGRPDL